MSAAMPRPIRCAGGAELAAQPKGSRPARTVVGAAFGSDTVNQQTAPVQAQVVEALGLSHLAKVGG
jgi:hypothetical protein